MRKFFFIDYDGTIFSHTDFAVTPGAFDALKKIKDAGHTLVIATGRSFTKDLNTNFKENLYADGFICANGAFVKIEDTVLWEKYFKPELLKRIVSYAMEKGYCLGCHAGGFWYTTNRNDKKEKNFRPKNFPPPKSGEAFWEIIDLPVQGMFLSDSLDAIHDMQEQFPELRLLYMGDEMGGADITVAESDKLNGIGRILHHCGATWDDVIAIGDSSNDKEMIAHAALGIAMGNGMQVAKEAADFVTGHIDEGGLTQAIDYALNWIEKESAK